MLPEGYRVTLYEHADFKGKTKVFSGDIAWVGDDFNDKTSSIVVEEAGVVIYEHAHYKGRSQSLNVGKYNMGQLSIGNDTLSSLKVPSGMRVVLYEHADFRGVSKRIQDNTPWIGKEFNDKVSSIIVRELRAEIYEHANFKGRKQVLGPGRFNIGDLTIGNDTLSSLRVPEGLRVTVYEHANFKGAHLSFTTDSPWIGNQFNDKTSAIVVEVV